jgi:hypothetical protein
LAFITVTVAWNSSKNTCNDSKGKPKCQYYLINSTSRANEKQEVWLVFLTHCSEIQMGDKDEVGDKDDQKHTAELGLRFSGPPFSRV